MNEDIRKPMRVAVGSVDTTPDFWDCDCDGRYIHTKSHFICPICGALEDSHPDSRPDEVSFDAFRLVPGDTVQVGGEWQHVREVSPSGCTFRTVRSGNDVIYATDDITGILTYVASPRFVDIKQTEED